MNFINWILSLFSPKQATALPVMAQPVVAPQAPIIAVQAPLPVKYTIDPKWGLVPELNEIASKFFGECHAKGYDLRITQGLRTAEQQAALYEGAA